MERPVRVVIRTLACQLFCIFHRVDDKEGSTHQIKIYDVTYESEQNLVILISTFIRTQLLTILLLPFTKLFEPPVGGKVGDVSNYRSSFRSRRAIPIAGCLQVESIRAGDT
jgi:hypothetical protein